MIRSTAFALAATLASLALAQPPAELDTGPGGAEAEEHSRLSIEGQLQWVTAYMFNGYNLGDDNLILQPEVTIAYEAYSNENLSITPWINIWANLTDADDYPDGNYFEELDLGAGVDITSGPWTLGVQYLYYNSPVDAFDDSHELGLTLSFDDSAPGRPISINPHATLYLETVDKEGPEGAFIELGIEPTWKAPNLPLTLSLPITTGINVNEYYFDSNGGDAAFGYVTIGLLARWDLNDHWYLTAGIEYWRLTADSTEEANDNDDSKWVGKAAVAFSF